jgi:MOSC domain-containing protein YiiM
MIQRNDLKVGDRVQISLAVHEVTQERTIEGFGRREGHNLVFFKEGDWGWIYNIERILT